MKLDMVGRTAGEVLAVQRDMLERLSGNDGDLWLERYKSVNNGQNPFAELVPGKPVPVNDIWKTELVAVAKRKLKRFFSHWTEQITAIPDSWYADFLVNAARFNMKPVFFPGTNIKEGESPRRWVKPGK